VQGCGWVKQLLCSTVVASKTPFTIATPVKLSSYACLLSNLCFLLTTKNMSSLPAKG
jgi:hypothetical protein